MADSGYGEKRSMIDKVKGAVEGLFGGHKNQGTTGTGAAGAYGAGPAPGAGKQGMLGKIEQKLGMGGRAGAGYGANGAGVNANGVGTNTGVGGGQPGYNGADTGYGTNTGANATGHTGIVGKVKNMISGHK